MALDARARIIIEAVAREAVAEMQRVGAEMKKLDKRAAEAAKRQQLLETQARRAGIALLGMATAGVALIASSTRLAARVETLGVVTRQLGKNAGFTAKEITEFEQSVKAQGITLRRTRESMALMMQSQIDLSHATDLAREAQDAAVIANVDSSEAFRRLVFVISSGNVRMARTLGLQVSFQQAYARTAETLGKNITELTQLEKVQARTNEVIRAGETIVGTYEAAMTTAGKKVLSLNRHVEETRRIIGEAFVPAFGEAVDVVTEVLQKFEDATQAQQRGTAAFIATATAIAGVSGAGLIFVVIAPKIVAGLKLIGVQSLATAGALGLVIAGIAGTIAVGARSQAELSSLKGTLRDLRKQVILGSLDTKDYNKAVLEAAEGTVLFEFAQRRAAQSGKDFDDVLLKLIEERFPKWNDLFDTSIDNLLMIDEKIAFAANRLKTDMTPALDATADAMQRMGDRTKAALDKIDRGLGGAIENMIDDIAFMQAGGLEIMATWQGIQSAMAQGVPVGQLVGPMQDLQNVILSTKVEAELMTSKEAQQQAKDWGFAWDPALATVAAIDRHIRSIEGEHVSRIRIVTENIVVTTGGAVAKQHGGPLAPVSLVGEAGPELIINGIVVPAPETARLLASGLVPVKAMQGGGVLIDGLFGSVTAAQGSTISSATLRRQAEQERRTTRASEQEAAAARRQADAARQAGGTSAQQTMAAIAGAASQEAAKAVEETVVPALSAFAAALPSEQGIGLAVGRQLQTTQAEVIRTNRELIALMEENNLLLELQGTADDTAQAVSGAVAQVAG